MTTSDNISYVTVETLNQRFTNIDNTLNEIRSDIREMKAEIKMLDRKTEINSVKIDELHYFMGIGFAVIAIVVALVGFVITLAPMFREMYKDAKRARDDKGLTRSEVQEMIDEALTRALGTKKS